MEMLYHKQHCTPSTERPSHVPIVQSLTRYHVIHRILHPVFSAFRFTSQLMLWCITKQVSLLVVKLATVAYHIHPTFLTVWFLVCRIILRGAVQLIHTIIIGWMVIFKNFPALCLIDDVDGWRYLTRNSIIPQQLLMTVKVIVT